MISVQAFQEKFFKAPGIFLDWIPGGFNLSDSTVLDFGCDYGITTLGIAVNLKPRRVIGLDINDNHKHLLQVVFPHTTIDSLPENLEFHTIQPSQKIDSKFQVDCIFSWSVFEHVSQPILDGVIVDLFNVLRKDGLFFMQIAPLYYSAFGSHLDRLLLRIEPWSHLTKQNNMLKHDVMNAEKKGSFAGESDENFQKIKDGCWSCYETLNKTTADEVISRFEKAGFKTIKSLKLKGAIEAPEDLLKIYLGMYSKLSK